MQKKLKSVYLQEKSFKFYLFGLGLFLIFFIYSLFDKNILIDKNIFVQSLAIVIAITFCFGFIIDSINFIKGIWSNFYGKIFHFLIASIVYAFSYSLSEKIIFVNTSIDPNFLQSSIYLFTALLNLPVWLLTFQVFFMIYTIIYLLFIILLSLLFFIFLFLQHMLSEISKTFKDFIPYNFFLNFLKKSKRLNICLKILKKKINKIKRNLLKKFIHSIFFVFGGFLFFHFLPIDNILFNSSLLKENTIIKKVIIFCSFYKPTNNICTNLKENELVRFYGNKFSKVKYTNNQITFVNNIECKK